MLKVPNIQLHNIQTPQNYQNKTVRVQCRTYELASRPNWGDEVADRLVIPCYGVSVV